MSQSNSFSVPEISGTPSMAMPKWVLPSVMSNCRNSSSLQGPRVDSGMKMPSVMRPWSRPGGAASFSTTCWSPTSWDPLSRAELLGAPPAEPAEPQFVAP
eukprot:2825365-Amphidinium_carterae.1